MPPRSPVLIEETLNLSIGDEEGSVVARCVMGICPLAEGWSHFPRRI